MRCNVKLKGSLERRKVNLLGAEWKPSGGRTWAGKAQVCGRWCGRRKRTAGAIVQKCPSFELAFHDALCVAPSSRFFPALAKYGNRLTAAFEAAEDC